MLIAHTDTKSIFLMNAIVLANRKKKKQNKMSLIKINKRTRTNRQTITRYSRFVSIKTKDNGGYVKWLQFVKQTTLVWAFVFNRKRQRCAGNVCFDQDLNVPNRLDMSTSIYHAMWFPKCGHSGRV